MKPFGQSASCGDLHCCFPFLSLPACLCVCVCVCLQSFKCSSMCIQVEHFELTPHRAVPLHARTYTHTHIHTHTNTQTAFKLQAVQFSRNSYTCRRGRKFCVLSHVCMCMFVCYKHIHKLANLPRFQMYLECFRRVVVSLPVRGFSMRTYMEIPSLTSTFTVK